MAISFSPTLYTLARRGRPAHNGWRQGTDHPKKDTNPLDIVTRGDLCWGLHVTTTLLHYCMPKGLCCLVQSGAEVSMLLHRYYITVYQRVYNVWFITYGSKVFVLLYCYCITICQIVCCSVHYIWWEGLSVITLLLHYHIPKGLCCLVHYLQYGAEVSAIDSSLSCSHSPHTAASPNVRESSAD